jgi:hypothetical protein
MGSIVLKRRPLWTRVRVAYGVYRNVGMGRWQAFCYAWAVHR